MVTTSSRGTGRILLLTMAALLAVTGCGYLPEPRGQFHTVAPLWSAKMRVVAGPTAVGDTVVVVAKVLSAPGQLEAVALDASTGKLRWRMPTTPSTVTPVVPLRIVHDDSTVYLMTPEAGRPASPPATLTAVDAVTGRQRWKSRPVEFSDIPQFCDATRTDICASAEGIVNGQYRNGFLRLDARTGVVLSWRHDPNLLRRLEHDLFQVRVGGDRAVIGEADAAGRMRWKTPLAKLATPGATPSEGWTVLTAGNLYVASFQFPPRVRNEELLVVDLARVTTVGVERSTGRRRWIDHGAQPSCGRSLTALPKGIYLRCRIRGVVTYPKYGALSFQGLDVTVERFDPATGKALWQWHAGNTPALAGDSGQLPPRLSATEYAVKEATGNLVGLDVRTGKRRQLDRDAVGWCLLDNNYESVVPYGEYKSGVTRTGVGLYYRCRLPHSPTKVVPPPVREIGATIRERYFWAESVGVHATEAP